jgi:hypothetical protein
VQESFLRAFIGLDRLRDPDRFAGWLGRIVANVGRGLQRRPPVVLLPDWPEPLHPAAADGLPSADDLDRADAVRAAVAGLPAGQRRAVALHYYADLPPAQIAEPAGAARASLHEGLAVAITAGAPVRVAESVLDRLAVPLPANDRPVPLPEPAAALAVLSPGRQPRYEPRNLAFADGLDGWLLGGNFTGHASHSHWQDYSSAAEDGIAVLSATVPRPAGFAFLAQEMFADDYRGAVITFRGEFRARDAAGTGAASRAGLFLRTVSGRDVRQPRTERAAVSDPDNHIVTISGDRDWTSHQVTARVPEDSNTVVFGVFLAGPGRIELRNAELAIPPA